MRRSAGLRHATGQATGFQDVGTNSLALASIVHFHRRAGRDLRCDLSGWPLIVIDEPDGRHLPGSSRLRSRSRSAQASRRFDARASPSPPPQGPARSNLESKLAQSSRRVLSRRPIKTIPHHPSHPRPPRTAPAAPTAEPAHDHMAASNAPPPSATTGQSPAPPASNAPPGANAASSDRHRPRAMPRQAVWSSENARPAIPSRPAKTCSARRWPVSSAARRARRLVTIIRLR